MKLKHWSIGLTTVAIIASVPLFSNTPVLASLQQAGEKIAQTILGPKLELELAAAKKIVEVDEQGKEIVKWEDTGNKAVVVPGDILRYSLGSDNVGDKAADNLVLTQPIPAQTVYVLDSAASKNPAEITYSIDGGKSFVKEPTIEVTLPDGTIETKPAPPETYTHVKWNLTGAVNPEAGVEVTYDVAVK
jgi:uncharacterized repeat protein (TIGR01451 family)